MTAQPYRSEVSSNAGPDFRLLAHDIGFTEGPVWTGRDIIVTSITRGRLYRMTLAGGDAVPVAEIGGGPNGLTFDPQTDRVWIAQNGRVHMPPRPSVPDRTAGIQSWTPAGGVEVHHRDPHSAPNDCVIGPDGRLWFTNPSGDPHEGLPVTGTVCALDTDSGDVEVLWRTDGYPNGLAFGESGQFYLAETRYGRVLEFRYSAEMLTLTGRSVTLPRGYPDGIAVAADGHLLITGTRSGAMEIYDGSLHHRTTIDFGADSMPTNVCFAGPDLNVIVVTLAKGGRVMALDSELAGLPLTHHLGTARHLGTAS
ncbi:MAG: hypothetical protein K0R68_3332 [Mycobacterium sp.]|nr:hypothetical protein [Mycobacterium sp.]